MAPTNHRSAARGYTLLELLLYVAVVSSLLLSVTMFLGFATSARLKNESISEVDQQGALALETITQAVRGATAITAPAAAAAASQLSVSVPTAAQNPTVFNLSGTTLQVQRGSAAAAGLTNGRVQVTAFTVKNLSRSGTPGIVQISLTLSRVNPAGRNEYDYTKTFVTSAARRWP